MTVIFQTREYQQEILDRTQLLIDQSFNVLIELDCGLGKRYLQYSLIADIFGESKLLLILQASTSLYETYNYLKEHIKDNEMALIDSRTPSRIRAKILKETRVVLCLPQTLANTLKKSSDAIDSFDLVMINEVDQIVRRMAIGSAIKQPYSYLFERFKGKQIIGMSGTLRDDHYVQTHEQMIIKQELQSLQEIILNSKLISMDSVLSTDIDEYLSTSEIIATGICDDRMSFITLELEQYIDEAKDELLTALKEEDPQLYYDAKKDFSVLFGALPVEPDLITRFHRGYLTRKYLWAMTSNKSRIHLINFGLDINYIDKTLPGLPGKFNTVFDLVTKYEKSVVLCSYLDTVSALQKLLDARQVNNVVISGQVSHQKRIENLDEFRSNTGRIVAILSNVGERDLDIPEAELLIIFDTINTTKTLYQKLKRSRGGMVRILFYDDTSEKRKVENVIRKISESYPWSTEILPTELIDQN